MKYVEVREASEGTVRRLMENKSAGRIHSVYNNICNLLIDDRLIAVGVSGTEHAPDLLISDFASSFRDLGVCAEMPIIRSENYIELGSEIRLGFNKCSDYILHYSLDTDFIKKDAEKPYLMLEKSRSLVKLYGTHSPLYTAFYKADDFECMDVLFAEKVKEILDCTEVGNLSGLISCSASISGLGIGLTPSGDDFISGVFLVLACGGFCRDELKKAAEECRNRTNILSYQMICNGAEGVARRSELDFLQAFFEGDGKALKHALHKVLAFGSSSGTDTMLGILTGIYAILNVMGCPYSQIREKLL